MKLFTVLTLLSILALPATGQDQAEEYGLKNPQNKLESRCGDYFLAYQRLPPEVRYTVEVIEREIFFYFPSKVYYDKLFNNSGDGIAIDVVRRDQYRCYEKNRLSKSWANIGTLLPPLFLKDMQNHSLQIEGEGVYIHYGRLPGKFNPDEIECNLLVMKKKYVCGYHKFSNLDFSSWDLLEMGLFRDTLDYTSLSEERKLISKHLIFTIPFKKNNSNFEQANIKPLYDSLELTDYNIREMKIRAYSSVEGETSRNIELQQQRAKNMVSALQEFQSPEIKFTVDSRENWVEFLNAIRDTKFDYMAQMTKDEIKGELKGSVGDELESVLKNHRKAIVEIRVEKKLKPEETNPELIKKFFEQSIQNKNINEALYIQELIFDQVFDHRIPEDFIGKLEVPESSEFGPLLNNFAVFNYQINDIFLYENIDNFERLLTILPDNSKILYNLTALKIKAWTEGDLVTNKDDIYRSIIDLESKGIEKTLIDRLKVNYYIILTEYMEQKQDYNAKNRAIRDVYSIYKRLKLSDQDLYSLAKYLSYYSKFDWAIEALQERATKIDASKEILYYYLKLTITNSRMTKQDKYRAFMLNCIEKDNQQFCDLFLPKPQGGFTFQLLSNDFLRKTYCENCNYETVSSN